MPSNKQIPEPWRSFLAEIDQNLTEGTRLDCMGAPWPLREARCTRSKRTVSELQLSLF